MPLWQLWEGEESGAWMSSVSLQVSTSHYEKTRKSSQKGAEDRAGPARQGVSGFATVPPANS